MDGPDRYLVKHFDSPLAWARVFGTAGVALGLLIAYQEYPPIYLPVGAALGFAGMGGVGLMFGLQIRLVCWAIGGLDRPVSRPDIWAMNLKCSGCDWQTTPDGPYLRRDCLNLRESCPECGAAVFPVVPGCPRCKTPKLKGESIARDMLAQVRVPRSFREFLRGHLRCSNCRCVYDRWGREVSSGLDEVVG